MTNSTPAAAAAPARPARPPEPVYDPEILALLDFEPVPRKREVDGGWTAELQREFIARLAVDGSPGRTCEEMGKDQGGVMKVYRSPLAASFRAAWDGAVKLARQRQAEAARPVFVGPGAVPPSLDHRRKLMASSALNGLPGQVRMHDGEWVDPDAIAQMAADAKDRITQKLLGARRLYLQEICDCPGKRAAFEILTQYPIDWDKAERLEPQDDEPWKVPNMRKPDMILAAENGWLGDIAHGEDKKAELRAAMDAWRAKEGMPPVDWDSESADPTNASSPDNSSSRT